MKDLYYQKKGMDGFGTVDRIWIAFVGYVLLLFLCHYLYNFEYTILMKSTNNAVLL